MRARATRNGGLLHRILQRLLGKAAEKPRLPPRPECPVIPGGGARPATLEPCALPRYRNGGPDCDPESSLANDATDPDKENSKECQ